MMPDLVPEQKNEYMHPVQDKSIRLLCLATCISANRNEQTLFTFWFTNPVFFNQDFVHWGPQDP